MNRALQARKKQGVVMHACPLTRCGLQQLFTTHFPDFTFLTATSIREMLQLGVLITADLVVSDIRDDEQNAAYGVGGLGWLQQFRGDKPLVIITDELAQQQLIALSGQPSLSVIALQTPETALIQQLQQVLAGKQVISPRLLPQLSAPLVSYVLTRSELRVLELLQAGYSVTQVAGRLQRSVKTVSGHKRHLMQKLRVDNEIALFSRFTGGDS